MKNRGLFALVLLALMVRVTPLVFTGASTGVLGGRIVRPPLRSIGIGRRHQQVPVRGWTPRPSTADDHEDGESQPLKYEDLEAGDVVEVIAEDITFWHPVPYRKTGVNPFGWQGIFVKNKINWNDSLTTANRPVMVQVYEPCKCICHFELNELKLVRKGDDETKAKVPKRKV